MPQATCLSIPVLGTSYDISLIGYWLFHYLCLTSYEFHHSCVFFSYSKIEYSQIIKQTHISTTLYKYEGQEFITEVKETSVTFITHFG